VCTPPLDEAEFPARVLSDHPLPGGTGVPSLNPVPSQDDWSSRSTSRTSI
jgi:hypothetical protein